PGIGGDGAVVGVEDILIVSEAVLGVQVRERQPQALDRRQVHALARAIDQGEAVLAGRPFEQRCGQQRRGHSSPRCLRSSTTASSVDGGAGTPAVSVSRISCWASRCVVTSRLAGGAGGAGGAGRGAGCCMV